MFYKIRGRLLEVYPPNKVIVEIGALSWEIYVPINLTEILRENFMHKRVEFFVVPLIRKNEYLEIYGFLEREERELFLKLNTLSRIGPKLALNLLSVFTPETLRTIILERKVEELARVPGIGLKKAEKLFIELKGLYGRLSKKGLTIPLEKERILQEARESLLSLGFKAHDVEEVLFKVFEETDTLEGLLKKALKEFAPALREEKP